MERFLLPCCQAVIIKFAGKCTGQQLAMDRDAVQNLFNRSDEQKWEINKLRQLNNIAYGRIDELHDTIFKMEQKIKALTEELRNVRNFSIDYLNDFQQAINQEYEAKLRAEQEAAQRYAHEMDSHLQSMIEWQEHLFSDVDSEENWRLLLECNDDTMDSYDTVDLTSE